MFEGLIDPGEGKIIKNQIFKNQKFQWFEGYEANIINMRSYHV